MMGRRRAGVAVGCRRSSEKVGEWIRCPVWARAGSMGTVPPVARRPPTKHELLCYAPSSSGLVWPATVRLRPVVMPGYYAHPCIIICQSRCAMHDWTYVGSAERREIVAEIVAQAPTKYELVIDPQDREGTRSRRAAVVVRRCRRGDRITMPFAALHEFAFGT